MMFYTFWKTVRELVRDLRDAWDDLAFRAIFITAVGLLLSGTLFYWVVEAWGPVDSFYFTVVTLTTVGYGDLAPTNDWSKLFTVFYIFVGIGVIASLITTLAARSASRASARHSGEADTTAGDEETGR
jgi:hypothetical protein